MPLSRDRFFTNFQSLEIDLTSASPSEGIELNIAGDFLAMDEQSAPFGQQSVLRGVTAGLQIDPTSGAGAFRTPIWMYPGKCIKGFFTNPRAKWSAQPGAIARLVYASGAIISTSTSRRLPTQIMSTLSNDPRVNGSIANLAASTLGRVWFDLGANWDQYPLVGLYIDANNVAAVGGTYDISCTFSSGLAPGSGERAVLAYGTALAGTNGAFTGANGGQSILIKPHTRFPCFSVTNGAAAAFGASATVQCAGFAH